MAGQLLNTYVKVTSANLVHYVTDDVIPCNSVFARYAVGNGDAIYCDSLGDAAVPLWPPRALSGAVEDASDTVVSITFDMAMAITDDTGWTVTVDDIEATISDIAASTNDIDITLSASVANGEVVLVSYDASAGNAANTGTTAVSEDIVNLEVTNNVAA